MSEIKTSKKVLFVSAYNTLKAAGEMKTLKRGEVVGRLAAEVGVSNACASTYLSNISAGKWSTTPSTKAPKAAKAKRTPKSALTVDAVNAMTGKALVEAYNKKADKPVTKFRDRASGLKRVMDLYGLV